MGSARSEASVVASLSPLETPTSRASAIVEQLDEAISRGRFSPGQRIGTSPELCAQFRVARATLSEALRVLQMRGLIEVRPGVTGGVFVAADPPLLRISGLIYRLKSDGISVRDYMTTLDALDFDVVQHAVAHRTDEDVADLRALLARMATQLPDLDEWVRTNWQLHARIAQISTNQVLSTLYRSIVERLQADLVVLHRSDAVEPSGADPQAIHAAIVDAIAAGDARAAAIAVLNHRHLGGNDTYTLGSDSSALAPPE